MTELLSQLDPKTRARLVAASDISIEKQATPSIGLNAALEGGLPYGRLVMFWGNKSAGKSSIAQQIVGMAQQEGKSCAWIDAEQSFDPDWAGRLGVDTSELIVSRSKSMSNLVDDSKDLLKAGADLIVIDSITSLIPSTYYSDEDEFKSFEKMGAIGSDARDLSKAVKVLSAINEKALVILISQQRNQIGSMFTQMRPTGGEAPLFYSSVVIKLWSSASDNKAIKAKVPVGDRLVEKSVGRKVSWTIENSKTSPQGATGEYDFYYIGESVGMDPVGEAIDFGELYGVINKSGNWYIIDGEKINGRKGAVEFLRENPEPRARIIGEINERIRRTAT